MRRLGERVLREWLARDRAWKEARYAGYLSAGELVDQAGLTEAQLDELQRARLLVPDREGRYRPKLAGWARKLAELLASGWEIPEIKAWSSGRWSTPNPRAWPPAREDWKNSE